MEAERDKATEYYNSADQLDITFVCSILDPRSKDFTFKQNLLDNITVSGIVHGVEENLVKYYSCLDQGSEGAQDIVHQRKQTDGQSKNDMFKHMFEQQFAQLSSRPSLEVSVELVERELKAYLAEDLLRTMNFDILEYWNPHQ